MVRCPWKPRARGSRGTAPTRWSSRSAWTPFAGDPISTFKLQSDDFSRLGARLKRLGCPVAFVLEGGYAASELGDNAANVADGFEQA